MPPISAWAVYYSRLKPVFVDCGDDLLVDIDDLISKITLKTKVIMVTHIYGRVANMDKIAEIACMYNLRIIEDAAEAHGCTWKDKMVGSFDIGCFSFYRNKIVCGEEGGAVTSNDLEFIEKVRDMKSMSFGDKHNYMHHQIGFNYRMTNSQASLILQSLKNVNKNITLRRKNDNKIVDFFKNQNIPARYGFKPVSMCAPFNIDATTTNAYRLSKHIMYLPVDPVLTNQQIQNYTNILKDLI